MPSESGDNPRRRSQWIIDLSLSALTVAVAIFVYWTITASGFVSDDYLWHSFFKNSISELYQKVIMQHEGNLELAYFRPTLVFSYQVDYNLFGDSPFAFHLVNIALHAVNSVMIYYLARVMGLGRFASFAGSIFFAVYPANAEAVNWISGRGDVLAATWILVSLLAWCWAREKRSVWLTVLSALAFLFAIGAKESAAATVFMLPLIDWLLNLTGSKIRKGEKKIGYGWRGYILFAAIVAGVLIFRWWLFGDIGGQRGDDNTATYFDITLPQLFSTLVFHNLKVMFTPVSRILWGGWPELWRNAIIAVGSMLGLVLAWAFFLSVFRWKTNRITSAAIITGILWIIIMMLPILPLFPVLDSLVRARYLYAPAIGLAIWAGAAMGMIWRGGYGWKGFAILMLAAVVIFSGYSIRRYNEVWIQSSGIADNINEVMAENTVFLADGGTVFQVNFPRHYKGVPCAPYRYGEYLEFLYGYKNVQTFHLEKDPAKAAYWWGALRRGWHSPAAAFLWDNPSKTAIFLPPIDPEYLERRDKTTGE